MMPPRLWMRELISQGSRCSGTFPMDIVSNLPISKNGYKLIYNHPYERQRVELYQLYDASGKRVDWEEVKDLSKEKPEIAESMKKELLVFLKEMNAGMTNYNPAVRRSKCLEQENLYRSLISNGPNEGCV